MEVETDLGMSPMGPGGRGGIFMDAGVFLPVRVAGHPDIWI